MGQKTLIEGTSLVGQWLRLCTPSAGGPCSIPAQRTGSHILQHSPLSNLFPGSVLYWYCFHTSSRNTVQFLSKSGRGDLSPSPLPSPSRELRGFAKRLAGVRAEPTLWPDLNLNSVLFDQPFLGILTTCQAYAECRKNRNKWDLASVCGS